MSKTIAYFLLCAWIFFGQPVFAITGNDWNDMTETSQGFYIMGVIDSWKSSEGLCLEVRKTGCEYIKVIAQPLSCFPNSPYSQLIAIVRKHMKDRPEAWQYNMPSIIWTGLSLACKNKP